MSGGTRSALLRTLAPLALMGLIFYASSQPAGGDETWWLLALRKLGHIGGYAALTALWAWALAGAVRRPVAVAVAIALAYACSDEYHQTFVDTRHGTPVDVLIDAVGIAIAALVVSQRPRAAKSKQFKPAGNSRRERTNRVRESAPPRRTFSPNG